MQLHCHLPLATIYSFTAAGFNSFSKSKGKTCRYKDGSSKEQVKQLAMSRRNGDGQKLELKKNLSASPSQSSTVMTPSSPPSSCISSELNGQQQEENCFSDSPDATSMIVAGCTRCLMYVMLPEKEPRCPKCKGTVLLQVFNDSGNAGSHLSTTQTEEKN